MLIIDNALAARAATGDPCQVAIIGAGGMSRGICRQIVQQMPGMRLAVICNRTVEKAIDVFMAAGVAREDILYCDTADKTEDAIRAGKRVVTDDPVAAVAAASIEAVMDATGHIDFGAKVAMATIEAEKHLILLNAEVDAVIGPLLKHKADQKGVIVSGCDGDQPAVQMNLTRYVRSLGLEPLLCGNIKGMQDRYRTPETQAAFAAQWGMTPQMVTSFADGTKISFEQVIIANATGMKVAQRGMIGLEHSGYVDEMVNDYDVDMLRSHGGIVDYILGAKPGPGCFVFAAATDDIHPYWLKYSKLGDGPLYPFYTPQHLMALEAPFSLVRAALMNDTVIAPKAGQVVDVVATAKRDLKAGETLDEFGGFTSYGLTENSDVVARDNLLLMGLSEGCVLKRDIPKDQVLTKDDVVEKSDTLIYQLRREQDALFTETAVPA